MVTLVIRGSSSQWTFPFGSHSPLTSGQSHLSISGGILVCWQIKRESAEFYSKQIIPIMTRLRWSIPPEYWCLTTWWRVWRITSISTVPRVSPISQDNEDEQDQRSSTRSSEKLSSWQRDCSASTRQKRISLWGVKFSSDDEMWRLLSLMFINILISPHIDFSPNMVLILPRPTVCPWKMFYKREKLNLYSLLH